MDNNTSVAKFRFDSYLVNDASIKLTGKSLNENIQIGIAPSGELVKDKNEFLLSLKVHIEDQNKNLELYMTIVGKFLYTTDNIQHLKPFICQNAPAILFPYIRAYITNITALAGMPSPIIIPTLNVQKVGEELLAKMSL